MKKKLGPKCKWIDKQPLKPQMKKKLMKHSDKHTLKHIQFMTTNMLLTKSTFNQSHKNAIKKFGK